MSIKICRNILHVLHCYHNGHYYCHSWKGAVETELTSFFQRKRTADRGGNLKILTHGTTYGQSQNWSTRARYHLVAHSATCKTNELRLRTETLKIGRAGSIWKAQMGSDKSVIFLPFGRHFWGKDLILLFWWLLLVKRPGVFFEMLVHFTSLVKGDDWT